MSFAKQVKDNLIQIISEMSNHPEDFSKNPESDFSRNRKLEGVKNLVSMENEIL